jgi:hypothetical protein
MRILLLPLFFITTCQIDSQDNLSPRQIDNAWIRSFKGKGKLFRDRNATPSETYRFTKKDKKIVWVMLTYPWKKRIEFFILDSQLIKVRVQMMQKDSKKIFTDVLYFDKGALVFQKQESTDSQDLSELKQIFIEYRNKAYAIKEKVFSKRS